MPDRVLVRSAAPSDFAQWKPLWDGYNHFYGRVGALALPEAITQTTWARFFDAAEPVHALVAEQGGRLLGLAHYLFHRSTILLQPTCYLQDLFTHDSARRKGVGRALIEAVYERAQAAGSPRVYWHTHKTNAAAIALYETLAEYSGFIVYRKQV